ncbi:hypothetical protein Hanom_Chr15g01365381 [Helianthus anomalus]
MTVVWCGAMMMTVVRWWWAVMISMRRHGGRRRSYGERRFVGALKCSLSLTCK